MIELHICSASDGLFEYWIYTISHIHIYILIRYWVCLSVCLWFCVIPIFVFIYCRRRRSKIAYFLYCILFFTAAESGILEEPGKRRRRRLFREYIIIAYYLNIYFPYTYIFIYMHIYLDSVLSKYIYPIIIKPSAVEKKYICRQLNMAIIRPENIR